MATGQGSILQEILGKVDPATARQVQGAIDQLAIGVEALGGVSAKTREGVRGLVDAQAELTSVSKEAGQQALTAANNQKKLTEVLTAEKLKIDATVASTEKLSQVQRDLALGSKGFANELTAKIGGKGVALSVKRKEVADVVNGLREYITNYRRISELKGLGTDDEIAELKVFKATIASVINILISQSNQYRKGGEDAQVYRVALANQATALKALGSAADKHIAGLKRTKTETIKAAEASAKLKAEHDKLNERIGIAIGKLLRYRIAFFFIRGAMDEVRDAVKEFITIQNQFAQLEKVLRPVIDSMEELRGSAFGLAQTYKKEVGEVIGAMTKWSQTGLSVRESIKATEATLLAANATNVDSEQVVSSLTAAIFAYGVAANETTDLVSKWIAVQARFPVTASDLMKSLNAIGIVAKDFRISIDELNGVIAGIGAVTRKTGKEIGQSLKTILARLPREETIRAFQEVGVAVLDAKGQFRPFLDIITDLRGKWDSLTEVQRKNISLTAGGIRRYVDFTALLDNFATVQNAVNVSMEASGFASRAAAVQLSTFQSTLTQSRAILAELRYAIGGELTKPLRLFIGGFNKLAKAITQVAPVLIKLIAGLTSFVTILLAVLIVQRAYKFSTAFLAKSVFGATEVEIRRLGVYKALRASMRRLKVEQLLLAHASGKQITQATAIRLAIGKVIKSFNFWVIAIDLAVTALSLLLFKQKEYVGVADSTNATIEDQARSVLSNVGALVNRQNLLNKSLKDRESILRELAKYEGKTDTDSTEKTLQLQKSLRNANQALLNEEIISRERLDEISKKSATEQLALQGEIESAGKTGIDLLTKRINLDEDYYKNLQTNRILIRAQIKDLEQLRANIKPLFGPKKPSVFEAEAESAKKLLNIVNSIADGQTDVEKQHLENLRLQKLTQANARKNSDQPGEATTTKPVSTKKIETFNDFLRQGITLLGEITDKADLYALSLGNVPDVISKETVNRIKGNAANIKATLESLIKLRGRIEKDATDPETGIIDVNKVNKDFEVVRNNAVREINLISGLAGDAEAQAINAITARIVDLRAEEEILSMPSAVEGAKQLGYIRDEIEGVIVAFEDLDFSTKFLKEFYKIVLGIQGAAKTVKDELSLQGVQKDAKATANALLSFYLGEFKRIKTLNENLSAEIKATQDALGKSQNKELRDRQAATVGLTDINKETAKLTAKLAELKSEEVEITERQVELQKTLNTLVNEQLRLQIFLTKEAAVREFRQKDLEDIFSEQTKLAELSGKSQADILAIERERIKTLSKMKIDQILLTENTDTQADLVTELGDLMIELRRNAREVTLIQLEDQVKRLNAFVDDLKSALSSAFASIPGTIVSGIEKRRDLADDLAEAEVNLQEALAEGDEEAIRSAKKQVTEIKDQLKEVRKFIYEIKETGKNLIEGVGDSLNKFLSDRFAESVIELRFKGESLGDKVAKAMTRANTDYIKELTNTLNDNTYNQAILFESFVQKLNGVYPPVLVSLNESAKTQAQLMYEWLPELDSSFTRGAQLFREALTGEEIPVSESDIKLMQKFISDNAATLTQIKLEKGVDPTLMAAIAIRENEPQDPNAVGKNIDPKTKELLSRDIGLMQVNENTAKSYGVSADQLFDTTTNLNTAARLLQELMVHFKGDIPKVIAGYNAGQGRVDKANGPINEANREYTNDVLNHFIALVDATIEGNAALDTLVAASKEAPKETVVTVTPDAPIVNVEPPIVNVAPPKEPVIQVNNAEQTAALKDLRAVLVAQIADAGTFAITPAMLEPVVSATQNLQAAVSEGNNTLSTLEFLQKSQLDKDVTIEAPNIDLSPTTDTITQTSNEQKALIAETNQILRNMYAASLQAPAVPISVPDAVGSTKQVVDTLRSEGDETSIGLDWLAAINEDLKTSVDAGTQQMLTEMTLTKEETKKVVESLIALAASLGIQLGVQTTALDPDKNGFKRVMQNGLDLIASNIGAALGAAAGGGSATAAAGGQIGASFGQAIGATAGTLGGPIGTIVGSVVGGFIGGLFGGKKKAKEFVPSIQANTEALNQNTLAIEQLQKQVINAPSNFNIPNFAFSGQSPAPTFNITVPNVQNPAQFVDQVVNRIQRDYQRGVRTGTTRKSAL